MEVVFLLVGLAFVAFGALVLYSEAQARRDALEVPGEVIGFSLGQSASGDASYHSVVEYGGVDGRARYVEASVGSSSPLGAVGDPVTVLAQPDDAERATIKSSLTSVVGAVLALMGLASCIVFFAIFRLSSISIAGAGLVVLGLHLHRKTELFLATAAPAPGIVVEMATNDSSNGNTYAPVVEFEHEGTKYRFKDSISSNPPAYRRGEAVRVLYDPVHPRNARIDRGPWNKAVPLLVGGFGALLCLLGLWSLQRRASGKTA